MSQSGSKIQFYLDGVPIGQPASQSITLPVNPDFKYKPGATFIAKFIPLIDQLDKYDGEYILYMKRKGTLYFCASDESSKIRLKVKPENMDNSLIRLAVGDRIDFVFEETEVQS